MTQEIIQYLSQYVDLSEELIQSIEQSTLVQSFPKGTLLLKEGEKADHSYFVLKGCIRSYKSPGYNERTLDFFTEMQIAVPLTYGEDRPSPHYLECLEDTLVTVSTPEIESEGFAKHPEFESLCRIMSEKFLNENQQDFLEFRQASPEERYLNLQRNRPNLLQRAPQYQIASYLGMTAESLSRIRKRQTKKKD
ncbi:Crp/Fnr family transcriptional regulator [bacterium SCSIO 12741]|nr:Crp/Fnr family transcriptional regulator [bacterium SCSIO 12741]